MKSMVSEETREKGNEMIPMWRICRLLIHGVEAVSGDGEDVGGRVEVVARNDRGRIGG